MQTSSNFFGLPMIATVIAEKTCDTPTCTLVEVFMINETFPVGQFYSRATYIQGIHLFSLKTPTLIFFCGSQNPGLTSIQFSTPQLSNLEGGCSRFRGRLIINKLSPTSTQGILASVPRISPHFSTTVSYIFFSDAPAINFSTPNLTVNESSKTQLTCKVSGNPLPLIRWTLPNGSRVRNNGLLEFDNTSRRQHGKYACQASNKIGNSSVLIYLNVQCKYFIKIIIKIIKEQLSGKLPLFLKFSMAS